MENMKGGKKGGVMGGCIPGEQISTTLRNPGGPVSHYRKGGEQFGRSYKFPCVLW